MCQAIKSRSPLSHDDRKRRITGTKDHKSMQALNLDSFVNKNTMKFFDILGINSGFLDSDPTTWQKREDFITDLSIVKSLHVTNDIAERSIALVTEYHNLLTKDEDGKQHAFRVVTKLRELSPGCTKENLKFSLENYLNNASVETQSNAHSI